MSDSVNVETAFSCDFCGELFNSPQEAQNHSQKAHTGQKDDSGRGLSTSSPAEDEEERRAKD